MVNAMGLCHGESTLVILFNFVCSCMFCNKDCLKIFSPHLCFVVRLSKWGRLCLRSTDIQKYIYTEKICRICHTVTPPGRLLLTSQPMLFFL